MYEPEPREFVCMCDVWVIRKDYELINMQAPLPPPPHKRDGAGGAGVRFASFHRSNLRILLGVFPEQPYLPRWQQLAQLVEMLAMEMLSFLGPWRACVSQGITRCRLS